MKLFALRAVIKHSQSTKPKIQADFLKQRARKNFLAREPEMKWRRQMRDMFNDDTITGE